jgi:hypothetical protein
MEQQAILPSVHMSVVSLFHRQIDEMIIKFHFFSAEQMICLVNMAFQIAAD